MKFLLTTLFATFILLTQAVWAEMAITPEAADQVKKTFTALEALGKKHPELQNRLDNDESSFLTKEGRNKIIAYLNASPVKAEATKVVKAHGFSDIQDFFDFSSRLTSAAFAYSKQTNTQFVDVDTLEKNIIEMKKSGASQENIANFEELLKFAKDMDTAAKTAKPADIAAMKKYPQILEQMQEGDMDEDENFEEDRNYDEYPDD